MSARTLVAGNWKMHKTPEEARGFCRALVRAMGGAPHPVADVAVFPPFVALPAVAEALAGSPVRWGAQNVHPADCGAFTGEVSASMLLTVGCQYVIIGHSERRALFAETDGFIREKVLAAGRAGLCPLLCVGETLEERDAGRTRDVVERQLAAVVEHLDEPGGLLVAYEPVWAIGTGRTATPEVVREVHRFIRDRMCARFGSGGADVPVLYGGSVKPDNARSLLAEKNVDGALVGGASLTAESFLAIIESAA